MPAEASTRRRNFTPPQIAERYNVATAKVIAWIRNGELKAINVANRGCTKPRYSVSPEALEDFEAARQVVPDGGLSTTQRLRRRATPGVKEYF